MTHPAVLLSLKYMPYTCPDLDKMVKHIKYDMDLSLDQEKLLDELIDQIKKDITTPFRTALELACERIITLENR